MRKLLLSLIAALGIWSGASAQTVTSPVDSALNVVDTNTTSSWRIWPLVNVSGVLTQVEPPTKDVSLVGTQLQATLQASPTPYTLVGLRVGLSLRGMGYYMTECPPQVPAVPCLKPFLFDKLMDPLAVPAGMPVELTYPMPLSGPSSVTASVGDTRAPTAPSNLVATPLGVDGAVLVWLPSFDNVGVSSYVVERCTSLVCTAFARVGTSIISPYSDTGLASAQSYSYRVQALDLAGNRSLYSNIAAMTTPVPPPVTDTTPPVVSITVPLAGVTVAGTSVLTASATDNVGVVGVQFGIDSASFSAEITAPPYTTIWNTTTVADGPHTINAVARDAAGNRASSPLIVVNVSNAVPPPPPTSVCVRIPPTSVLRDAAGEVKDFTAKIVDGAGATWTIQPRVLSSDTLAGQVSLWRTPPTGGAAARQFGGIFYAYRKDAGQVCVVDDPKTGPAHSCYNGTTWVVVTSTPGC